MPRLRGPTLPCFRLCCALLTSCSEIAALTRNSLQNTSDKGLSYVLHLAAFSVSASTMMK